MSSRNFKLEACVTNLSEARQAERHGANRVEICTRLETEGMTPDTELVSTLCNVLRIPIRVMIRHTEEGYEVNENILQQMSASIRELKKLPIEGFVFGVLKNNKIDREYIRTLAAAASPLPVTFHKAIDNLSDVHDEIAWLNQVDNIDTILTSGGAVKATDGIEQIREIKERFRGDVMAGGKILQDDLDELHQQLGLNWYHGRRIVD